MTGTQGSLLENMERRGNVPKIMFTNTSAEYWRGDAALIHTDLETLTDAPESPSVRRYHFAGCQHGSGDFPPLEFRASDGIRGQLPLNSVDYAPLLRAALDNLDRWVSSGEEPPASRHPSLDDGTAVESHTLLERFGQVPGVKGALADHQGHQAGLRPGDTPGPHDQATRRRGRRVPALVADLDESFNEVGGIRLPDLSVPVATYTGWNLRDESIGNPGLFIGITGGLAGWTLPLRRRRQNGRPPAIRARPSRNATPTARTTWSR